MRCLHESGWTGALAGPRRHAPDLGPHRDQDHWCATGSPGLLRRGLSCRQRAWPRADGRGIARAPRRHPRRAARAATGLRGPPHIWPVTKRGGLYPQEQRHPTPVAEKDLSPPSRGGPYAEEDKARCRRRGGRCPSQQVRTMPRQAMEGLYPVSRGGRYQEEDKHHTPAQGEGPTR